MNHKKELLWSLRVTIIRNPANPILIVKAPTSIEGFRGFGLPGAELPDMVRTLVLSKKSQNGLIWAFK